MLFWSYRLVWIPLNSLIVEIGPYVPVVPTLFLIKYELWSKYLTCLRDCFKIQDNSDIDTLNYALKILATHGWEKTTDASFGYEAIQSLLLLHCKKPK